MKYVCGPYFFGGMVVSPPSRGAWIEIPIPLVICRLCSVAPLAGGVD